MFEKLRSAFSDAAKSLGEKELNEKDIESILFELEISLLESDVAGEVIDEIKSDLKEKLIGSKVNKHEVEKFVKVSLISSISALFDAVEKVDLIEKINEKKKQGQPFLVLFVGINGTGKTTSLVKIAHLLQQAKFSIVIAAADTFRAGAIEQLREHTNRLNLKLVAQNYNSDPAAVARDAVLYAKSHKTDCVLIDTAGRMQTNENLMQQIAKITKVVNPDMKIFVGDSLAGNDTVNQAREFHKHVQFNASILTKSDADAKGGAALSIVKVTSTPIIYLGTGQEYPDLKPFSKETFLKDVFGSLDDVDIKESPKPEPQLESPKPEPQLESPKPEPQLESPKPTVVEELTTNSSDDPFEGINDDDIATYSDLYDIPPPENDNDAIKLGNKIRKWIKDGRLEPGESKTNEEIKDDVHKQDKEEEPKKKRGRFGFLKK
ncbi:MAG: signal recognition particle-docking protein FtsY [Nitrosopumilus sp.]|nr:signal recognition particle-docking protein FtsY [Nitrosopumilus sp.]NRA05241.1 signal recognition particle-docking protein FtsY [Nitrosopumilus sp.]